ncbi:cation-translocating P-type ATPase [Marinobacterium sedimentorum]|uniref:cation-translocating P-type ATPase n=1 Tax=Marinobacterium sedimentorum TaxID=2927804 RepID=UPI0020C6C8CA|nr:cation-translocating P-type ATPase [Marinobacterium sedimentorum]MCP8686754.1 cation-translocating P-type ATPase [Marinobacterium sedimentorum]
MPSESFRAWHSLSCDETLKRLTTSVEGLTAEEAQRRLATQGPNRLPHGHQRSVLAVFAGQFSDLMILVLLAAAVISGMVGEPQDTIAILVIVLLNGLIGAIQEFRAERAMAALRKEAAPRAQVLRDGRLQTVDASALVPGDLVLVEAGNQVPADLRLIDVQGLEADESAMTGESLAVVKTTEVLTDQALTLGDRHNLLFKSSTVSRGRGRGLVIATGMDTEIGHIARLLETEERVKTPLQQRMSRFGRYLAMVVLAICSLIFVTGLLRGEPVLLMFLTAVSLAVAAIPEALPAVVTLSLTFGARKLSRHHALVRKLPAVETLGAVTYICTDKTGTLTQNRMTAEHFMVAGELRDSLPGPQANGVWCELGQALTLNNDVTRDAGQKQGEPTELALLEAAERDGFDKAQLETSMPRIGEIPFTSERQLMTTLHRQSDGCIAYIKGSPERVIAQCRHECGADEQAFSADARLAEAQELAAKGYRVLALALRHFERVPADVEGGQIEQELCFLGLVALIDPPRPEVPQAVADCLSAGITPVMITGDHPATARAIAQRLGICSPQSPVMTGPMLAELSDEALARQVAGLRVYARVSPAQKIRIVKALQARGEFVAMTGDGINDAPALKRAGIGIAMGLKGTDVAREAADMVLLDDNFATIVSAVREGRRIFDNIRKFIQYTMTSNAGEVLTLFLAPFLGLPLPLLPIHILWINLVTDGLPGLAFAVEPAEPGSMQRPPRPPNENIFARGMWQHILWVGLLIAGLSLASQAWAYSRGVEHWQTLVFTVLTLAQLFNALAVRSEKASLWKIGLLSNLPMLVVVVLTFGLQLLVIYLPVCNDIFSTQPLPLLDLLVGLLLAALVVPATEAEKWLIRRGYIYRSDTA